MKAFFILDDNNEELGKNMMFDNIMSKYNFHIAKRYEFTYSENELSTMTVKEFLNMYDTKTNNYNVIDHVYLKYKGENFLRSQIVKLNGRDDVIYNYSYLTNDIFGTLAAFDQNEPKIIGSRSLSLKRTDIDKFDFYEYNPLDVCYFTNKSKNKFDIYSEYFGIDIEIPLPAGCIIKRLKYNDSTYIFNNNKLIVKMIMDKTPLISSLMIDFIEDGVMIIIRKNEESGAVISNSYNYHIDHNINNPLIHKRLDMIDDVSQLVIYDDYGMVSRRFTKEEFLYEEENKEFEDSTDVKYFRYYFSDLNIPFSIRDLCFSGQLYCLDILSLDKNKNPLHMTRNIGYF